MTYPAQTSGVGVAAAIEVAGNVNAGVTTPGKNNVILSLSGTTYPESFQLNPELVDAAGTPVALGTQFTLTAVANSSGNTAVYTGTVTGGGSNAFAGKTFEVAGFTNAPNNGSFICTASTTTTLTLENASAVAETHAATATTEEGSTNLTYTVDGAASLASGTYKPSGSPEPVVSVSSTGNLTTNGVTGGSVVEVSFPAFNNGAGTITAGGQTVPLNKIYAEVNVTVVE